MIMERAGKVSRVILNHVPMIGFVLGQKFGWNLQLTVSTDDSKSCKSILLALHTLSLVKFFFICTKTIL